VKLLVLCVQGPPGGVKGEKGEQGEPGKRVSVTATNTILQKSSKYVCIFYSFFSNTTFLSENITIDIIT
jgi:hypothetical protein